MLIAKTGLIDFPYSMNSILNRANLIHPPSNRNIAGHVPLFKNQNNLGLLLSGDATEPCVVVFRTPFDAIFNRRRREILKHIQDNAVGPLWGIASQQAIGVDKYKAAPYHRPAWLFFLPEILKLRSRDLAE